jgi:ribitol-5-phosphate 2-dehydrogenase (NADP+) / D-ribitol-5-phosphate cytidylyltransferase
MTPVGDHRRTVAAVLAGGSGSRLGGDRPKQLQQVAGRTLLEHAVAAFDAAAEVDEVVVVIVADWLDVVAAALSRAGFGKVSAVLPGASTRSGSTATALGALGEGECNVLIHDAARPLVEHRVIRDCVRALDRYEAVLTAIPSPDTVVEVSDATLTSVPLRARSWLAQTPQGFHASTIRRAYELARGDRDFEATDDASVVLRYLPDVSVRVVEGSPRNLKVTVPDDLLLVAALLASASG